MKPKVLVCAFSCLKDPDRRFGAGNGGEGVLGKNIILQLGRFCDVFVLTHSSNREAIEVEKSFSVINFYYIDLPVFFNFTKKVIQIYTYLWQIKAYFTAKKLHKENHFDIFHHITYANDWMASHTGALLPVSYVRGPGGGAQRVPAKFVAEYPVKEHLSQTFRSAGQWLFRHDPFFIAGQNRAKALLVCNKESFDALPEKWQEKAYMFPVNGISKEDLLLFRTKPKTKNKNFTVLTAGKLIKIKGFDLAIKAFKVFSEKNKDADFIIVGDGPELENLQKLIGSLGLEDKVKIEKWMPRETLLEKMLNCDVFLFPSLRDGGGNVVVEAMAAGKPVVCFDMAGPAFHIDEKCGIKIKPDFPEQAITDIAKALEKLYSDENLKLSLGKGAMEKAQREYDWDRLGDRLKEIYGKIL